MTKCMLYLFLHSLESSLIVKLIFHFHIVWSVWVTLENICLNGLHTKLPIQYYYKQSWKNHKLFDGLRLGQAVLNPQAFNKSWLIKQLILTGEKAT